MPFYLVAAITVVLCRSCYGCEGKCNPGETCIEIPGIEGIPLVSICVPGAEPVNTTGGDTTEPEDYASYSEPFRTTTENTNQSYNVCDANSVNRTISERMCDSGWKCIYGVCRTDEHGSPWCDCDPGAVGQVCQDRCCKDCVFGSCYYYRERSEERV